MEDVDYTVACTPVEGDTTVALRLVPRAAATRPAGLHGRAVKLRVTAPPVDGRANEEAVTYLADVLGLRPRDVEVVRGGRSRSKVVLVRGAGPDEVAARLSAATLGSRGGREGPRR